MMPLLLVVVAVVFVAITFEVLTDRRDRKAEIEAGETPLHDEICGARIDLKNWTMPFVRLTLYPKFAVISYAQKIVLPYGAIDSVAIEKVIAGRGVRIRHHHPGVPERLIIWSTDVDGLRKKLADLTGD